jgi:hypothetical protein
MRHDPMLAILADLLRRVDALAGERGHISLARLRDEIDWIRHIARAFHLDNVEGLAGTLQSALSLQGAGPVVMSYLDLMRDAIAAEMPDAEVIAMPVAARPAAGPGTRLTV